MQGLCIQGLQTLVLTLFTKDALELRKKSKRDHRYQNKEASNATDCAGQQTSCIVGASIVTNIVVPYSSYSLEARMPQTYFRMMLVLIFAPTYIYIYMYLHIYVCTHTYMYVYIHTYCYVLFVSKYSPPTNTQTPTGSQTPSPSCPSLPAACCGTRLPSSPARSWRLSWRPRTPPLGC